MRALCEITKKEINVSYFAIFCLVFAYQTNDFDSVSFVIWQKSLLKVIVIRHNKWYNYIDVKSVFFTESYYSNERGNA